MKPRILGALSGGVVGLVAHLLDASPWWWLAVPIGFFLLPSLRIHLSISWGRK